MGQSRLTASTTDVTYARLLAIVRVPILPGHPAPDNRLVSGVVEAMQRLDRHQEPLGGSRELGGARRRWRSAFSPYPWHPTSRGAGPDDRWATHQVPSERSRFNRCDRWVLAHRRCSTAATGNVPSRLEAGDRPDAAFLTRNSLSTTACRRSVRKSPAQHRPWDAGRC